MEDVAPASRQGAKGTRIDARGGARDLGLARRAEESF
jgi:hypothetical protein